MSDSIKNWDDLSLHDNLLRGIYTYGFENPTPIQCSSILPLINNKDIIAQAQSGTGKTGSFAISSLQKVNIENQCTQILVIAPTRELVKQIKKVFEELGQWMNELKIKTLV